MPLYFLPLWLTSQFDRNHLAILAACSQFSLLPVLHLLTVTSDAGSRPRLTQTSKDPNRSIFAQHLYTNQHAVNPPPARSFSVMSDGFAKVLPPFVAVSHSHIHSLRAVIFACEKQNKPTVRGGIDGFSTRFKRKSINFKSTTETESDWCSPGFSALLCLRLQGYCK